MTRAIVVYESVFGNARTIARAIAAGLSTAVRTDVVAADEAPAEHYLVAGITGPLLAGEVDRARRWGTTLGAVAVTAVSTRVGHG